MSEREMSSDEKEALPPGAARKLIWFGCGCIAWIVVGFAWGWHLGLPDEANTLGDFLAGVFAPAAFVMLLAAVWIQSDELREQRKELVLTRKEFAYNREVMQAQAEEARRQAEFIERQTEIVSINFKFSQSEEVYNSCISLVAMRLRQYSGGIITHYRNSSGGADYNHFTIISFSREFYYGLTDVQSIAQASKVVANGLKAVMGSDGSLPKLHVNDGSELLKIEEAVDSSWSIISKMEGSLSIRAKALELEELSVNLRLLREAAAQ